MLLQNHYVQQNHYFLVEFNGYGEWQMNWQISLLFQILGDISPVFSRRLRLPENVTEELLPKRFE